MFPILIFFVSSFYSMRKWSNSISAYILLCIWVYGDVRLGPLSVIACYILFVLLYYLFNKPKRNNRFVFSRLIMLFSFYVLLLSTLFSFLGTDMPVFAGLSSIKSYLLIFSLLNIFWNLDISKKDIKSVSNIVILSVIVLGFYCLFSYVTSTNYYMEYVSKFMTDGDFTKEQLDKSMNDERGILHGRISGTSFNCLPFSILLSILFFYILSFKDYVNKQALVIALFLIFICLYMTGSRGSMAAVVVSLSIYLLRTVPVWKQITIVLLLLILSESSIVSNIMSLLVADEVGGSTLDQRVGQIIGAIELISPNYQSLFWGRGLGYASDYVNNYGLHPICLAFESTLVHGLVDYGILGLIFIFGGRLAFCLYIAYTAYKNKYISRNNYYLMLACLSCNIIYNVLIGNGYDNLFIISYFMMIKFFIIFNENVCNVQLLSKEHG